MNDETGEMICRSSTIWTGEATWLLHGVQKVETMLERENLIWGL